MSDDHDEGLLSYVKRPKTQQRELSEEAWLLTFFRYDHLPPHLQIVSMPFASMAEHIMRQLPVPERTEALRKLVECKDCTVRAATCVLND